MADVITRFKVESTQYEKKIKDAKKSIKEVGKESSTASLYLQDLEKKLGLNISSLTKFGLASAAVVGALKLAKDAFLATESGIDEWGRTTQSAKSLYDGFLQSLNTGDISGYLSNIDKIKQAAIDAYNAIDALGTMKGFSDIDLARLNTEKMAIQLAIKKGKANGTDVKDLQDQLIGKDEEIERIASEKAQLAKEAYDATFRDIVIRATGGRFDEAIAHKYADTWEGFRNVSDEKIKEIEAEIERLAKEGGFDKSLDNARRLYASGSPIVRETERQALALDQELAMIKAVKEQETKIVETKKLQLEYEQAKQQSLQSQLSSQRYLSEGKTGGSSSSDSKAQTEYNNAEKAANKAREQYYIDLVRGEQEAAKILEECYNKTVVLNGELAQVAVPGSMNALNMELRAANDALNDCVIGSEEWAQALEWVRNVEGQISLANDGKQATQSWSAASGAISRVGSALQSIDDPAAKVAGIIAQAIASVASGAGKAMSAKDTTSSGWAWIGAAASITAEMITIISAIKSATEYHAAGGFVGNNGLARGTDTVPAMLTPGELVLNKSQQANLASHLSDNSRGGQVEFRIKDRELYGILSNYQNRQSNKL